jgi:CRP-like cAMP-binding protein
MAQGSHLIAERISVNARARLKKPFSSEPFECAPACTGCLARELGLCQGLAPVGAGAALPPLPTSEHVVPARRVIFRPRDLQEVVPFICQGWAASAVALSDGSRQILSFLLPGEIVSSSLLIGPVAPYLVEAITEVRYRCFKREDMKARVLSSSDLLERLLKVWQDRQQRAHALAVDLGRRTAEERIARLILGLKERLAPRGMATDQTMEFPLRQHHIADATGLTAVHVSKVTSEFRRRGLIEIQDRSLTILDPEEFLRIATMR